MFKYVYRFSSSLKSSKFDFFLSSACFFLNCCSFCSFSFKENNLLYYLIKYLNRIKYNIPTLVFKRFVEADNEATGEDVALFEDLLRNFNAC